MIKMIKNAGNASSNLLHSISFTEPIINVPTIIKVGGVMAATPDTAPTNGPKKEATMNNSNS